MDEKWSKIQEEGVLWGKHDSYRYTYLSPVLVDSSYGNVCLEVDYTPKGPPHDNYGFSPPEGQYCWQFSVFDPIPISQITRLKTN